MINTPSTRSLRNAPECLSFSDMYELRWQLERKKHFFKILEILATDERIKTTVLPEQKEQNFEGQSFLS